MVQTGLTVFHNPSCTKSRKSTTLLEESQENGNFEVQVVKYKESPPSRETLETLVEYLGMKSDDPSIERPWKEDSPWDYLLRPEAQKKAKSFEEAFDIIENDPAILERPFVIDWDNRVAVLGRPDISRVEKLIAERVASN